MEAGQADSRPAASAVLITTENSQSSVVEGSLERDEHHPHLNSVQGISIGWDKGLCRSIWLAWSRMLGEEAGTWGYKRVLWMRTLKQTL